MNVRSILLSALLLGAAPHAATAAATASVQLFSVTVDYTLSAPATVVSGELFSLNTASLNGAGGPTGTQADNSPVPGTADAAMATSGTISADSIIAGTLDTQSFDTQADGTVSGGSFGSATGRVTGSLVFTNSVANSVLAIVIDYTRIFDLETDVTGDLSSGRTALTIGIADSLGTQFVPTITLSDPACDANATFTAANGGSFTDTCTGTVSFAFDPLAIGDFTLTFGASSNIDVVAGDDDIETPAPGALALFGLGLAAVGLRRRAR